MLITEPKYPYSEANLVRAWVASTISISTNQAKYIPKTTTISSTLPFNRVDILNKNKPKFSPSTQILAGKACV